MAGRTTDEWEAFVGSRIRAIRIDRDLDQAALARHASVSRGSIANLEAGRGSTLATLVKVLRALGKTEWFEQLDGDSEVSPMELLKAQRGEPQPRRRARRKATG